MTDLALLRLLQLVSPGLPIGTYCYSQGFESAVDNGLITNAKDASEWLTGIMNHCLAKVDIPLSARMYQAWQQHDIDTVMNLSTTLLAHRETSELRSEDRKSGQALVKLLAEMKIKSAIDWKHNPDITLAAMFTLAAVYWKIPIKQALGGYLWSWLENQSLCAVKLIPLGQVAGQQLLHAMATNIPGLIESGLQLKEHDIGGSVFGLALVSSCHEMQYSRLFRS
ncbi:MAG TPA: urease accessory protein UreF [Crenotrichaceae bacterium]|nr:urease accessory protein UreF [Crenotrichaceae bacterium]